MKKIEVKLLSIIVSVFIILQCMPCINVFADSINLHVWLSKTGMGEQADFFQLMNDAIYVMN